MSSIVGGDGGRMSLTQLSFDSKDVFHKVLERPWVVWQTMADGQLVLGDIVWAAKRPRASVGARAHGRQRPPPPLAGEPDATRAAI